MVSLAAAIALSVAMVQNILLEHNMTLPTNVDFFDPLLDRIIRVPVAPDVEFFFVRQGNDYIDWYDFYLFQVRFAFTFYKDSLLHCLKNALKDDLLLSHSFKYFFSSIRRQSIALIWI